MPLSRSARIITLLVIDTAFFVLELVTGYWVGSLALVADSFHMLNDVLSLVVALYTIKLATSPSSAKNSYGWQRAEILGALINGVFLVALCVSIFLEAIGRLVSPPEISNPKIIVIVGSLGLLSNIVGLFLFHEHGHSHSHSHGPVSLPEDDHSAVVEESPSGRARADSMSSLYAHPAQTRAQVIETAQEFGYGRHTHEHADSIDKLAKSPPVRHVRAQSGSRRTMHRPASRPNPRRSGSSSAVPPIPGSNDTRTPTGQVKVPLPGAPSSSASTSGSTVVGSSPRDTSPKAVSHDHDGHDHASHDGHDHSHEHAHDLNQAENGAKSNGNGNGHDHDHSHGAGGHGHSHGSMNMRGVFLHVLGDALGNVGVISAGLVIWFLHGRWTLYFDPGVSLLITCIIFSSALPLVKSASYILMQGVPSHVSLDSVRDSINEVAGVVSVHELHVWQLSESTVVASVHVLISPGEDYMVVANGIRHELHGHGIHSVTIQPEQVLHQSSQDMTDKCRFSTTGADPNDETACLIRCPPEQCGTDTCCPPVGKLVDVEENHEDGHTHSH